MEKANFQKQSIAVGTIAPAIEAGRKYTYVEIDRKISYQNMGIPVRYLEVEPIRIDITGERKGVIITGGTGTGKTTKLVGYLKYLRSVDQYGRFTTFPEIMYDLKSRNKGGWSVRELIDKKILGIDDLGAEMDTEYSKEVLFLIVNGKYNNNTKLLISTNLTGAELTQRYGERIYSRIIEMCNIEKLIGKDFRTNS